MKKNWHSFSEQFFNSLCLFLICGVPGPCSNDFFHTALIIKFIHFPSCTIPLNKKLWVITPHTQSTEEERAYQELSIEGNLSDCVGHGLRWKICVQVLRCSGPLNSWIMTYGFWFSETEKYAFFFMFIKI